MGVQFGHKGHLVRVVGLFLAGVLAFLVLQAFLVPKGFGVYGHYRAGALEENRVRAVAFAGRAACVECHSDVPDAMKGGRHAAVHCEACHGPLAAHASDPTEKKAVRPDSKVLCARCHAPNVARPAKFPQVEVAEHASGEACTTCHVAHDPGQLKEAKKVSADRREFLARSTKLLFLTGAAQLAFEAVVRGEPEAAPNYKTTEHWWAMTIDIEKCIGCGNCVRACKEENDVPREPFYFRTWVERYHVPEGDIERPQVDSPNGGYDGFPEKYRSGDGSKSFFVPKLCNHCAHSPCVQVCPVGATFESPDGVVLVDKTYCLGCRYCVQACPYGCRFIDPRTATVDKCSLCYHRITKGLTTACCETCPTEARVLGDLKNPKDPIHEFLRTHKVQVLKPQMATGSKTYYNGLDGSVR